jgi:hypothetical protein
MPAPTPLRRPLAPRSREAIHAEMTTHFEAIRFHSEAMKSLASELIEIETGRANPLSRNAVSLKEASRRTGWRVARIREHVMRRANRPDLPQLGFQPGDVANSPWFINMDVLTAYIAGQ